MTQQHDALFDRDAQERAESLGDLVDWLNFPGTLDEWVEHVNAADVLRQSRERMAAQTARVAVLLAEADRLHEATLKALGETP